MLWTDLISRAINLVLRNIAGDCWAKVGNPLHGGHVLTVEDILICKKPSWMIITLVCFIAFINGSREARWLDTEAQMFWKQTWFGGKSRGYGVLAAWQNALGRSLPSGPRVSPLRSLNISLSRSEKAFFSQPICHFVFRSSPFPTLSLFLLSLSLDKARRQTPLTPGPWMEFLGLSDHKYFFFLLKV